MFPRSFISNAFGGPCVGSPFLSFAALVDASAEEPRAARRSTLRSAGAPCMAPEVDVVDGAEAVTLTLDVPGVSRDALTLTVEGDTLQVAGERAGRPAPAGSELARPAVRFSRAFRLPPTLDPDGMSASLADGVLTITVPKRAAARPRQIRVTVA